MWVPHTDLRVKGTAEAAALFGLFWLSILKVSQNRTTGSQFFHTVQNTSEIVSSLYS